MTDTETTKKSDIFGSAFERAMMREAFPGLVGRAMYCAKCQGILDASRAVEIEVDKGQPSAGSARMLCARCFDGLQPALEKAAVRYVVTDGRKLFPPPVRTKRPSTGTRGRFSVTAGLPIRRKRQRGGQTVYVTETQSQKLEIFGPSPNGRIGYRTAGKGERARSDFVNRPAEVWIRLQTDRWRVLYRFEFAGEGRAVARALAKDSTFVDMLSRLIDTNALDVPDRIKIVAKVACDKWRAKLPAKPAHVEPEPYRYTIGGA